MYGRDKVAPPGNQAANGEHKHRPVAPEGIHLLDSLEAVLSHPTTRSHERGMLVIDDTGDRKSSRHTTHVGRQYLGSVGKVDQGIVAVTSLWADDRLYYPLHVEPYTPKGRGAGNEEAAAFRSKPQIALALIDAALEMGVEFRAVVADSFYGDNLTLEGELSAAEVPYLLAVKPSRGLWAPVKEAHTPAEAARRLRWAGQGKPRGWTRVEREFRDGHGERWWAADLRLGSYGPDRSIRMVVATTDPETLPELST